MVPEVTILIPTCNRPEALAASLSLLGPQVSPGASVEIRICDDSDTDGTRDMLAKDFPQVIRIPGPRRGPGANRNAGAETALGRWLVFLDDDVLPHAAYFSAMLAAMRDPANGGHVLAGATFRSGADKDSLLFESPHYDRPVGLPPSCNFAMPREVFLASGGFDERFRHSFEDMEFFARLERSGVRRRFVKEAAVDHPIRRLPPPAALARRWEARVISGFDSGASAPGLLWRLPRHVFLVILARFRGRKPDGASLLAAGIFVAEFFLTVVRLPGWLLKYRAQPVSSFWSGQMAKGHRQPGFGL